MELFENNGYIWDVSKLIDFSQSRETIDWEIPLDFTERWSWGDSHLSDHILRCVNAERECPILICDGWVVDGCHRVCRALSLGQTKVKAIDLTEIMPPPDWVEEVIELHNNKWSFGDMVKILKALDRVEYDFRHPIDGV